MNSKTLRTILFLIVLTLVTAVAWHWGNPVKRRFSARGLQVSLPPAKAEKAAKIVIRWRDVHTTLKLENGRWLIGERENKPASVPRISALLNSLGTLAPVKELRNLTPETLRALRLVDNDPKLVPGVRVVLYDASGKELFNILLGKGHFMRPEPGTPPSGEAEGRYVLIGGRVYLLPVVFENCHPIPAVWVEPLRLHEMRRSLQMTALRFEKGQGRPVWSVYRKSTAHPFTMAYPAGKTADNQQLSALADSLSKPFTMDYYTPGKPLKIEYRQRLTVRCADGFTYVLSLAEGNPQYDIVSLAVQYDPKRVLRFPGETDQQYQRRLQGLKQRFEFESRYSSGQLFKTGKELSKLLDAVPERSSRGKGQKGIGTGK